MPNTDCALPSTYLRNVIVLRVLHRGSILSLSLILPFDQTLSQAKLRLFVPSFS